MYIYTLYDSKSHPRIMHQRICLQSLTSQMLGLDAKAEADGILSCKAVEGTFGFSNTFVGVYIS